MRWTATLLIAMCMALATAAQAAFHGREIRRRPDMGNVDMVDTVSWYANESIRLSIEPVHRGARLPIPDDATALWIVTDEGGTNWIVRWASAVTPTNVLFELAAGEGALPAGHDYSGFVDLMRGTNVLGVIDRFEVACITSAYGTSAITPAAGTWEGLAGAVASNTSAIAEHAAAIAAVGERIDGLWVECAGGWRWPDYFWIDSVTAGVSDGAFTNAFEAVLATNNVVFGTGYQSVYKGWRIDAPIIRSSTFEAAPAFTDASSSEGSTLLPLSYTDGFILFPPDTDFDALDALDDAGMSAIIDRTVTATLGGSTITFPLAWRTSIENWYDHSRRTISTNASQRGTTRWNIFVSPAPGTLLADIWDHTLGTVSNRSAYPWNKDLRTWSSYGNTTNTQTHPAVTWNTNFFAYGLADFSSVSWWAEGANASGGAGYPGGVYRPVTMVTPRHGIVANHWKPAIGSNVLWLGRSGAILTNRVTAYANLWGDLSVARLAAPLPTNEVTPAALFPEAGLFPYLAGTTNALGFLREGAEGTWGVPVILFDCAERGGLSWWQPRCLRTGTTTGDDDSFSDYQDDTLPQRKVNAVGGDSGSPTFVLIPGIEAPVLLGCLHTSSCVQKHLQYCGGPIPHALEVNSAIAEWGDSERAAAVDFSALGYPSYFDIGIPGF